MVSEKFKESIDKLIHLEPRVEGLIAALEDTDPSVSVRFNRYKLHGYINGAGDRLQETGGVGASRCVPWCGEGRYLEQRPRFTFDPALHQGLYYVQDASSMFISHVIGEITRGYAEPMRYFDACAAPGGKSTAAIDALPEGSLVVANEWDFKRAEILKENIMKWGYPHVVVSRGDTRRFSKLRDFFDIIAADVPCSGEGMMRKDAEAVAQWSPALVQECAGRQREIVDNLWNSLKPGGYLIYSTCTFNREENEMIVDYICDTYDGESVEIDISPFEGILPAIGSTHHCYRFMPHLVEGEGLFMAVIKKPGVLAGAESLPKKVKQPRMPVKLPAWAEEIGLSLIVKGDTVAGVATRDLQAVEKLSKSVDVILAGVELGTIKGKDFIPSHHYAMSTLDHSGVNAVEVDHDTALAYLRRDSVVLADDAPRGHVMLMYGGYPLGWVKNLGNRSNNLYPASWRILSSRL